MVKTKCYLSMFLQKHVLYEVLNIRQIGGWRLPNSIDSAVDLVKFF